MFCSIVVVNLVYGIMTTKGKDADNDSPMMTMSFCCAQGESDGWFRTVRINDVVDVFGDDHAYAVHARRSTVECACVSSNNSKISNSNAILPGPYILTMQVMTMTKSYHDGNICFQRTRCLKL
jgi:hypothetical protein